MLGIPNRTSSYVIVLFSAESELSPRFTCVKAFTHYTQNCKGFFLKNIVVKIIAHKTVDEVVAVVTKRCSVYERCRVLETDFANVLKSTLCDMS